VLLTTETLKVEKQSDYKETEPKFSVRFRLSSSGFQPLQTRRALTYFSKLLSNTIFTQYTESKNGLLELVDLWLWC